MNLKQEALHALFCGRMNVPNAAKHCGMEHDAIMLEFKKYAEKTPLEDWELDTLLCWPYA
jgi:hypothetical protein